MDRRRTTDEDFAWEKGCKSQRQPSYSSDWSQNMYHTYLVSLGCRECKSNNINYFTHICFAARGKHKVALWDSLTYSVPMSEIKKLGAVHICISILGIGLWECISYTD